MYDERMTRDEATMAYDVSTSSLSFDTGSPSQHAHIRSYDNAIRMLKLVLELGEKPSASKESVLATVKDTIEMLEIRKIVEK